MISSLTAGEFNERKMIIISAVTDVSINLNEIIFFSRNKAERALAAKTLPQEDNHLV